MRNTKQKEIIKNGLEKFCIHPTAEELYLNLKQANPSLSLATVYRNLNKMASKGEIKKIEGLSEQIHYDHNNCEHFHIICTKCNKIMDLPPEMADSLKSTLQKTSDFEVISYDIIVKGICDYCRKKGQ